MFVLSTYIPLQVAQTRGPQANIFRNKVKNDWSRRSLGNSRKKRSFMLARKITRKFYLLEIKDKSKKKISLINAKYTQLIDWCCALGFI